MSRRPPKRNAQQTSLYRRKYPICAHGEFQELNDRFYGRIRAAISRLRLDQPTVDARLFKEIKEFRVTLGSCNTKDLEHVKAAVLELGDLICNNLHAALHEIMDLIKRDAFFSLGFIQGDIDFEIHRLTRVQLDGPEYLHYAGLPIRCEVWGKVKNLYFTRHALERLRERIDALYPTYYRGWAAMFSATTSRGHHWQTFDVKGNALIAVYIPCLELNYGHEEFESMFNDSSHEHTECHLLLGYYPIDILGDAIIAKTFLRPGMAQMPEREAVRQCWEKIDGSTSINEDEFREIILSDAGFIETLHHHVTPQIVYREPQQ